MNARLSSLLVAGGVVLASVPSGWLSAASPSRDGVAGLCNLQEVVLDRGNGTVLNLVIPGFNAKPVLQVLDNPSRVVIDMPGVELGTQLSRKQLAKLCCVNIQKVRMAKYGDGARVVLEVKSGTQAQVSVLPEGISITLETGKGPVTAVLKEAALGLADNRVSSDKQEVASTKLSPIPSIGMPFHVVSSFAVGTLLPTVPGNLQDQPVVPPGATPIAVPQPPAATATPIPTGGRSLERNKTLGENQMRYSGSKMSFDVKNVDIQDFLRIIADHAHLNLVCDPDVQGNYTVAFKDVPWDQVLDVMLKHVGLGKEISNGVIRVAKIEKLQKEEEDRKRLEDAKALAGDLQTVSRPLSFAKVSEAKPVIEKMLTKRGSILTDERTNTLIISDLPRNIGLLDDLIAQMDVQIQQVQIEARVVEANKNFDREFGVVFPSAAMGNAKIPSASTGGSDAVWMNYGAAATWNSLSATKGGSANQLGTAWNTTTAISNPAGNLWVSFLSNRFSINAILQAMELEGKVKIVSSPKLVTQNNKKAKVLSGRKIPYSSIQSGAAAGAITVSFIDANLELDVLPQITNDGTIIMDIKLEKAEADFSRQVMGTPTITRRSLETQVLVKDGGTAVLGGVYSTQTTSQTTGVPFLSKIPVLGWLFRSNSDKEEDTELLIFVTPRIIKS